MLDAVEVTPIDGRIARSHRTRAAIVDALIALLEEGNVQPTVEEIATRAGVAPRTVFQHYADRERLFAAIIERRVPMLEQLMAPITAGGSLAERVDALVEQRERLYEAIAPVRRAALLMEPFSEAIQGSVDGLRGVKRRQVAELFAPELAARAEADRDELEAALAAAASWSVWDVLRTQQGLDVARARGVLRRTLLALLSAG